MDEYSTLTLYDHLATIIQVALDTKDVIDPGNIRKYHGLRKEKLKAIL